MAFILANPQNYSAEKLVEELTSDQLFGHPVNPTLNLLRVRSMYFYRNNVKAIEDEYLYLYRLALTWDRVKYALTLVPDQKIDEVIRKSIQDALDIEPQIKENLISAAYGGST